MSASARPLRAWIAAGVVLSAASAVMGTLAERGGQAQERSRPASVALAAKAPEHASARASTGGAPPAPREAVEWPASPQAASAEGPAEDIDLPSAESVLDTLSSELGGAGEDPEWQAEASQTLQDRLGPLLREGTELRSLECVWTMCRIEIGSGDTDTLAEVHRAAFGDPERGVWEGASFAAEVEGEDGEPLVVAYVAREGLDLPLEAP